MKHNPVIQEKWEQLLSDFKIADQTITQFCKINNVKIHQFTYWRNKLEKGIVRKKKSKSSFIKLIPVNKETIRNDDLSIVINRIKINIPVNFNPESLTKLIKVVRAID